MLNCKTCDWKGREVELIKVLDEYGSGELEACPTCRDTWSLEDME